MGYHGKNFNFAYCLKCCIIVVFTCGEAISNEHRRSLPHLLPSPAIDRFWQSSSVPAIQWLRQPVQKHHPFHRDSVKINDLLLTFASKFLLQIARFQLSRGVMDDEKSLSAQCGMVPYIHAQNASSCLGWVTKIFCFWMF